MCSSNAAFGAIDVANVNNSKVDRCYIVIIKSLELKNYRNYKDLLIEFSEGTNILYGNNAQGKTNILEAIYVCATTKSHRGSKDREIINFNMDDAHICMKVERRNVLHKIDMHLKRSKTKGAAIDGLVVRKSSELFGVVNVVFFSPEDLGIIKNGPSERRRFIDLELCQLNKIYMHNLTNYNKVVNQRNNLLRQLTFNMALKETLEVWDAQLVSYGSKVIEGRQAFIRELGDLIGPIHDKLSGHKEQLRLVYEPSVEADAFEKVLFSKRDNDIRLKTSGTGPHRDDINFIVNGIDIRKFGSQGQQRTAALSLKLAEIELVKRKINDTPILLLDDVLSELDSFRQNYLLESIKDIQTVITCTGLDEFVNNRFSINKVFKVVEGTLEAVNGGTI